MALEAKIAIFLLLFTVVARGGFVPILGDSTANSNDMEIMVRSSTNETEHRISTAEIGITFFCE